MVALFGEALSSVIIAKIELLHPGKLGSADRWMLERMHRMMLSQIGWMRLNVLGCDLQSEAVARRGVGNSEVVLSFSDPAWCDEASREAQALRDALGPAAEVHHIGSTAVAELKAKPILDLAVALPRSGFSGTLTQAKSALDNLGYHYVGVRGGLFFEKGDMTARTHALQIHLVGSPLLAMLLHFRDRLRSDDELRGNYEATKVTLARHLPRRRWIYAIYKGHWIQEQQWRALGAAGWADWYVAHRHAQSEIAQASRNVG